MLQQHQASLGRCAFDDPVLARTIADVCVAHGLRQHELEDQERFPERRDIRGDLANVEFLAIALRLGDLLDISTDRACPLLLNAACPLPADSFAHWTQYHRISHRLTAPDQIAITADCINQQEHRVLQDWCQWIVDEARNARIVMARAARHSDWVPPTVGFDPPDSTIVIRPAVGATYLPSSWIFELDRDAIFERLIHDVYDHPLSFVRELIQNSLDAMRCRMYLDLSAEGQEQPPHPTMLERERRERYSLIISLEARQFANELSGELETRQVLVVEDSGIGMDRDVIERFFLQVGRSYYTTETFRRAFKFVPTSRFGIGFLSVFAASDHITVDTLAANSGNPPIRLTLTGPRNYLLTETGRRKAPGTTIEVILRQPLGQDALTQFLKAICLRVEFPIVVNDLGSATRIVSENSTDFTYERLDVTEEGAQFFVRAYPINRPGIEGELYVFGRTDKRGESWAAWDWARYRYPQEHPQATVPEFVSSATCLHGIAVDSGNYSDGPMSTRLDYRGRDYRPALSRRHRHGFITRPDPVVSSRWEEILQEHLQASPRALGPDAWRYKQSLMRLFRFHSFWESVPETIKSFHASRRASSCIPLLCGESIASSGDSHRRTYIKMVAGPPFARRAAKSQPLSVR